MIYPTISQFMINGLVAQMRNEKHARAVFGIYQDKYVSEITLLENKLSRAKDSHSKRIGFLIKRTGTPVYQAWLAEIAQTEYGLNLSDEDIQHIKGLQS